MSDSRPEVFVLIGNGLSIEVNPELRLDRLTSSFLETHREDRDDLDRLLAEVQLSDVDPELDFEGIVAGLEATEEVVAAFMGLASRSRHPDLREAASLLQARGVPRLIRRLYYAYCAEILDAIGEGAKVGLPESVIAFANWLKELHKAHEAMGVFTLNYDVLIERLFLSEDFLSLKWDTTDFFSGLPERSDTISLAPGADPILGRLFYPEDPPPGRPIHLHHLHGCLTHFRRRSDGAVFKFTASDVRSAGVFQRLADAEDTDFEPAVILGSKKVAKSREWPFAFGFLQFEQAARRARTIVIAGYSFRDEAVNSRLRAAAEGVERRWIVINRKDGDAADEFIHEVDGLLHPARPEYLLGGFGGDLPSPT
jgi:hypothetical protein